MPPYTDHLGLVITTNSALAAARYADGIELLLALSPGASAVHQAAVAAAPASRSPPWRVAAPARTALTRHPSMR